MALNVRDAWATATFNFPQAARPCVSELYIYTRPTCCQRGHRVSIATMAPRCRRNSTVFLAANAAPGVSRNVARNRHYAPRQRVPVAEGDEPFEVPSFRRLVARQLPEPHLRLLRSPSSSPCSGSPTRRSSAAPSAPRDRCVAHHDLLTNLFDDPPRAEDHLAAGRSARSHRWPGGHRRDRLYDLGITENTAIRIESTIYAIAAGVPRFFCGHFPNDPRVADRHPPGHHDGAGA